MATVFVMATVMAGSDQPSGGDRRPAQKVFHDVFWNMEVLHDTQMSLCQDMA